MFDIAIVGGGLAGATAAAVFGRRYRVALIDPHESYPPVFAADKIAGDQIASLRALNLFEPMAAAATPATRVVNARYGQVIERKVEAETQRMIGFDHAALDADLRPQHVTEAGR